MTPFQQQQIKDAHFELPEECRRTPASSEDLAAFECEFGPIPPDYRWYLAECGGGVIGSDWIDGIEQLAATHRKFREGQRRGFYRLSRFFPLGWDGSGNIYGYDLTTGHIVVDDPNFGGVHQMASELYDLLCKKGLVQ